MVEPWRQGGLGIANTITSVCNLGLLTFALKKKLGKLDMEELRAIFAPLIIAGVLAGLTAWGGWQLWEYKLGHHGIGLKIGSVFGPAILAGLVYWLIGITTRVPAAHEIVSFLFAKFSKKPAKTGT